MNNVCQVKRQLKKIGMFAPSNIIDLGQAQDSVCRGMVVSWQSLLIQPHCFSRIGWRIS